MKKALVVIDMQHDNFADSSMTTQESQAMIAHTNQLIAWAKSRHYPLYMVQHISTRDGASDFLSDTEGAKIHPDITQAQSTLIVKHYPSSFRETKLQEHLDQEGITTLIVSGAMTHMCIDTTVRAGADLGYTITLVEDACFTKDLEFDGNTISAKAVQTSYMAALDGTFCQIVDTATLIENT